MKCRSSSDDLGCYEHSGGFQCDLEEGHQGPHQAHVIEVDGAGGRSLYFVLWLPMLRWDSASKAWVNTIPGTNAAA